MATRSLNTLALLARIAVAAVFLYAGALKIIDSQQFAIDVHNYRLLPWSFSVLVALYLPWLEIVCAIAVLMKKLYRGALLLLFALTLIFAIALSSAWMRGIDIACGCFGAALGETNVVQALLRDLGLMAAIVFLGVWEARKARSVSAEQQAVPGVQGSNSPPY